MAGDCCGGDSSACVKQRIELDKHNRHASVPSMRNLGGFFMVLALSLDG
jgi:hypothetical protein